VGVFLFCLDVSIYINIYIYITCFALFLVMDACNYQFHACAGEGKNIYISLEIKLYD
jgi:hypothetical protein